VNLFWGGSATNSPTVIPDTPASCLPQQSSGKSRERRRWRTKLANVAAVIAQGRSDEVIVTGFRKAAERRGRLSVRKASDYGGQVARRSGRASNSIAGSTSPADAADICGALALV
jgi:hypothetical protein